MSVIPNIPHLHRLHCHPPASLFQSLSHYLPSYGTLCHRLSLCSYVSDLSPLPPFISFPDIYSLRLHLTFHLLFHWNCTPYLLCLHCCPAFTIPFLLSPPTFIVLCHCLNTLLSLPPCATSVIQLLVQYDLSSLIFLLLFTMLVMYHLLCSSLLLSLLFNLISLVIYSILAPLFYLQYFPLWYYCSTMIYHILSTFLHYAPLKSNMITPLSSVFSTLIAPLILIYTCSYLHCTARLDRIRLDHIGSDQFGSAHSALVFLSLLWTFWFILK